MWTTRPRSKNAGIASIKQGDGHRLLLIHGVGLRAEAWNAQIDCLSNKFRVIAADMPGHGESDRIEGKAELMAFTSRMVSAIESPAVVLGHSMGALIALNLAIHYPDLVRGVVAMNAVFRRTEQAKQAVRQRAASLSSAISADPEPALKRWFGSAQTDARSACETWLKTADIDGYSAAYRVFAKEDGPTDQGLAGLGCPALFMTGGQDHNSTPEMSEAMARSAPFGRSLVVDKAAHMMPMTHPDQVNEAVLAFTRECAT